MTQEIKKVTTTITVVYWITGATYSAVGHIGGLLKDVVATEMGSVDWDVSPSLISAYTESKVIGYCAINGDEE